MYRRGSVFVVRYSFSYTEPPIFRGGRQNLRFLRFYLKWVIRRTSDIGGQNIIINIFKTTQNLRFWSLSGGHKPIDFVVIAYIIRRPPILEYRICFVNIFNTSQTLRF